MVGVLDASGLVAGCVQRPQRRLDRHIDPVLLGNEQRVAIGHLGPILQLHTVRLDLGTEAVDGAEPVQQRHQPERAPELPDVDALMLQQAAIFPVRGPDEDQRADGVPGEPFGDAEVGVKGYVTHNYQIGVRIKY